MIFRADECAKNGYEEVQNYFVLRNLQGSQKARSKEMLADIVHECGSVIDSYPSWHPLVSNHDSHKFVTVPHDSCGYKGLDHTRYFVNGFITCPYGSGQEIIDSVKSLPDHPVAYITAERLDEPLYRPDVTPILVRCEWKKPLLTGGLIPTSLAVPLILEKELPCWRWAQFAETWESMRPYFLGNPHGSRSSLFVTQETGQTIKKIWNSLIYTGMFGPIKV